jgi:F420-non-reducing hydrogenase iron-sulfur subunit
VHNCFKGETSDTYKFIALPCSGKVTIPYLMKVFEGGADGAILLTCKEGDCQHLEGNLRAAKRAEMVDSLLDEIGMGKGRIKSLRMTEEGLDSAKQAIEEFRMMILDLEAANSAVS